MRGKGPLYPIGRQTVRLQAAFPGQALIRDHGAG